MSGHKRNRKEMKRDFQNFVGDMAEHKPSENARKFFEHKPYTCDGARNLIKLQGGQIEHGNQHKR